MPPLPSPFTTPERPRAATWAQRLTGITAATAALLSLSACMVDPATEGTERPGESSTPSATPTPSPTPPPRSVSLNVSGDLLWHSNFWRAAEADARVTGNTPLDFVPTLSSLEEFLGEADLALCHEEVPFADPEGPFSTYPAFNAPPQIADALKEVGFDACTAASNHSWDRGFAGLVRTAKTLEAAGLPALGIYTTQEEARQPQILTTEDGVKVAVISQSEAFNGIEIPQDWSVDTLDADLAIQRARAARQAGADVVVVHMHAGKEYQREPTQVQRDFVQDITASGEVDLVFGQHAHVVQPVELVNGVWVAYGLGNLAAQQTTGLPHTLDGAMMEFTLVEDETGDFEVERVRYAPTFIQRETKDRLARVLLISEALQDPSPLAEEMKASAQRTRAALLSGGVQGMEEYSPASITDSPAPERPTGSASTPPSGSSTG